MRKTKVFWGIAAALLLLSLCALPAWGETSRLDDGANLLSQFEAENLTRKLDRFSEERNFDFVIVTVDSLEGRSIVSYSDDYYDAHGYRDDGILLLIDMGGREFYASTSGLGISYFNEEDLTVIESRYIPYLSSGQYGRAFETFLDCAADWYDRMASGIYEPDEWKTRDDWYGEYWQELDPTVGMSSGERMKYRLGHFPFILIVISLIVGLVISLIKTGSEKKKLTSVAARSSAADYIRRDSFALTESRDMFLYSNVTKTRISSDSNRSSGGGHSGGSFHTSSGGHSHGGHGGHF